MIDYIEAHKFCMNNRKGLESDTINAAALLPEDFEPKEITEWIEDTSELPYALIAE